MKFDRFLELSVEIKIQIIRKVGSLILLACFSSTLVNFSTVRAFRMFASNKLGEPWTNYVKRQEMR